MKKTVMIVLGICLIIFGAVALAKGGIPHTAHHEVDMMVFQGSINTHEVWAIHPALAGLALAGGAVLIFLGARSK